MSPTAAILWGWSGLSIAYFACAMFDPFCLLTSSKTRTVDTSTGHNSVNSLALKQNTLSTIGLGRPATNAARPGRILCGGILVPFDGAPNIQAHRAAFASPELHPIALKPHVQDFHTAMDLINSCEPY